MREMLTKEDFSFICTEDKAFIVAFDAEMNKLGYTCNKTIGDGYCWGRKMIIYSKAGVKSKKSYARVYMRENDLILRMYFSDVDRQRQYIENAPNYIQQAFTGEYGVCKHCHNMKEDGLCSHRKCYTIFEKNMNFATVLHFGFSLRALQEYLNI